jgi:hypothetical protein
MMLRRQFLQATAAVTALTLLRAMQRAVPPRRIPQRSIRVFDTLDARVTFEDFLSLLRLHAAGNVWYEVTASS